MCGVYFPSLHAVRTHLGKARAEASTAYTHNTYAEKSARQDKHMTYALNGLPQCRCCFKKFSSWRAFCGHHQQRACPVRFGLGITSEAVPAEVGSAQGAPAPGANVQSSATVSATPAPAAESTPLAKRTSVLQAAAKGDITSLAGLIRCEVVKGHCPFCQQRIH